MSELVRRPDLLCMCCRFLESICEERSCLVEYEFSPVQFSPSTSGHSNKHLPVGCAWKRRSSAAHTRWGRISLHWACAALNCCYSFLSTVRDQRTKALQSFQSKAIHVKRACTVFPHTCQPSPISSGQSRFEDQNPTSRPTTQKQRQSCTSWRRAGPQRPRHERRSREGRGRERSSAPTQRRRSGQSVTASDFGSNGPRFESDRGRCVESLDKALYSHCPKEKPSH